MMDLQSRAISGFSMFPDWAITGIIIFMVISVIAFVIWYLYDNGHL